MATCVDVSGTQYPSVKNNIPVKPPRGISLNDKFKGTTIQQHEFIFWEHEGHGAIRKGDWKLVSDNPEDESIWELYNLKLDRTETNNLAKEKPDIVKELKGKWEKMAFETKVWPKPAKGVGKKNRIDL
jgi:arylsulfatase